LNPKLQLVGETFAEKAYLVADVGVEGLDRHNWHVWYEMERLPVRA
jgi:hypothetical protein